MIYLYGFAVYYLIGILLGIIGASYNLKKNNEKYAFIDTIAIFIMGFIWPIIGVFIIKQFKKEYNNDN